MKPYSSLYQMDQDLGPYLGMCQTDFERSMVKAIHGKDIRERAKKIASERSLTKSELAIAKKHGYREREDWPLNILAKEQKLEHPKRASNADIVGKELPMTLYEVVQIFVGDKLARVEIKPITVIGHDIDNLVGSHLDGIKTPTILFVDTGGATCSGTVDMFYADEAEAYKECASIMATGDPGRDQRI